MKKELISLNRKDEICATLKQLLERKGIQKISIQELADACGISRYTFYYHFADIYDCLSWMLQAEVRKYLRSMGDNPDLEDITTCFIQMMRENKGICKHLLGSSRPDLLHQLFHQEATPLVRLYLSGAMERQSIQVSEAHMSALTDFVVSGLEGVLAACIQTDHEPFDKLCYDLFHIVRNHMAQTPDLDRKNSICEASAEQHADSWNYLL